MTLYGVIWTSTKVSRYYVSMVIAGNKAMARKKAKEILSKSRKHLAHIDILYVCSKEDFPYKMWLADSKFMIDGDTCRADNVAAALIRWGNKNLKDADMLAKRYAKKPWKQLPNDIQQMMKKEYWEFYWDVTHPIG